MLCAPKHFINKWWFQIERTLRVWRLNHEWDLDVQVLQTNKANAVYTEVNEAFAGFKNQLHSLVYYVVTVSNSPKCLQMSRQSRLVKSYPSSIHFLCFPRIALKIFHLHRSCCLLVLIIWDQILVNISTSIVFIDQLIFWHIHTQRTLPFPFTSHMTVT